MIAALLALLLAAAGPPEAEAPAAPPYVVVLADGSRLPLLQEPRWAFGRAAVLDAAGRQVELRWTDVDHEATKRANPDAQRAAERRRVWTNRDLERLRGSRLNVVDNGGPAAPLAGKADEAAGAATRPAAGRGRSESEWRERATGLQSRIAQLEAELDYLERARESWEAFALGTGGTYDGAAAHELGKIRRESRARTEQLQRARRDWDAVQEEARKASVPPGWLR